MENRSNERLIYLKDLIFCVLYRWKMVLAVALIFALLLGGYKGITSLSGAGAAPDLSDYEAQKNVLTQQIEAIQKNIDGQQAYLDNAYVMQLDPYDHYLLTMRFYIDTGYQIQPDTVLQTPDIATPLLRSYRSLLTGSACREAISQALEVEALWLTDALRVSDPDSSNVLYISFRADTQDSALLVQAVLQEQLQQMHAQLSDTIGSHSLRSLENTVSASIDQELVSTKAALTDQLKQQQVTLGDVKAQLDALTPPAVQAVSLGGAIKSAVKFAILGAVLAVFLAVVILWIAHIASSKVYSARTLVNRTGVKIVGTIAVQAASNPIDKKLRAWEGRNQADPETQAAMLAVSIRNRCKNATKLLLTGSAAAEQLRQALGQAMPGVQIESTGDILESAAALEALADCDAVVLTEQCSVSRYESVSRRIELIRDHEKQLIGCVLLNG